MENNKQTSDTESAIEAMTLQDTIHMEPEEQNEVERSLTELQWQQQLNGQLTVTDLGSQAQGKTTEETERTECRVEGSGRQHPPNHPDCENPKQPQSEQTIEERSSPEISREAQNPVSHNRLGTEEYRNERM